MGILSREYNTYYRSCVGSFFLFFSTRVDLYFEVHKLTKFLSNNGRLHFGGLVQLLRYIRGNKTLGLKYYPKIEDSRLSNILRQAIIKTEKQLVVFSNSILQDFPDTVRSKVEYIVFYKVVTIYHCTHVPGPVAQYIS